MLGFYGRCFSLDPWHLLYRFFSSLGLISKLLLRVELFHKDGAPWGVAELCERFQALLRRHVPLNLSVFITRTLWAVLLVCCPAGVNGGSSVGSAWHPCLFRPFGVRTRGWARSLCPQGGFALAAGGWGFLLPPQGKTCLRVLSIHLVPRRLTASTSAAGCKNAQAGAWCYWD